MPYPALPRILDDNEKRSVSPIDGALLASLCKAVGDPLRLAVLRVLSNESFGVQELAAIFAMPQPGMSHHLKVLTKSGLLTTRRQGNSIFYRRSLLTPESHFYDFQSSLFTTVAALPLSKEHTTRIARVYLERSSRSKLYFERNADKFEENQGMLCELSHYLPNLKEMLDLMGLPRASRIMEVGPGQGLLLSELARRFDYLLALDNSEEMLALTRGKIPSRDPVHFVRSSLEEYTVEGDPLDAAVMNMVLHHMPSPLQAFCKLKSLIRPGGFLLIADLCSHDQEWTRLSCGDVWMGFDPQELNDWAIQAGFSLDHSVYLGLKNGFQIQLKLFHAL